MYENITKYIGNLAECGEWVNSDEGTPQFIYNDVVDNFLDDIQDFLVWDYDVVLDQIKQKLSLPQISADVPTSLLDEEEVLSLITGIVTREKFIPGILASYLRGGAVDRWLARLKQLDEDESRVRKIRVVWSKKLTLDEAIKNPLSQGEGLYYISYQNDEGEQSLMLSCATYSNISEHLKAYANWWKKAVSSDIFVRIGTTSDIDEALSSLLQSMGGENKSKIVVENIKS